ncbi:sugar ABC transporter ATP-binding protein [Nitratireductor sp. StC3]|uniref:sugar ABC transporter ATP-binding protein n=1 Tax=Nitratireductor sp. StC3 TaxID=2126741 RepID=UPI000D0D15E5|nr:sugar ABC transporter ATP-binding protein [Nitratireductor sp. StC3]PSM15844.1 sugar ABC transporter ATP-binding protein [Nitratireductor sp. StC3]
MGIVESRTLLGVKPTLSLRNISKTYGAVQALTSVSVDFFRGCVHGIVGENGAGKSTLMKVLTGAVSPDNGEYILDGQRILINHPREAQAHGISIVHQELNLFPHRTIAENIFAGRELVKGGRLQIDAMWRRTAEVLKQLEIDLDPDAPVGRLSIASQQMIEIARSVAFDASVLIFDEPTATLAEDDCRILFSLIRKLRASGLVIIYISHRMAEIFDLCDEVTVIKDGRKALSVPTADVDPEQLVSAMIGRRLDEYYPARRGPQSPARSVLKIVGGSGQNLSDINLELRGGEVTGVFGLKGSGRSELAYALWGSPGFREGVVTLDGCPLALTSAGHAMRAGIGFVPEDRKSEGLALELPLCENLLLAKRVLSGWLGGPDPAGAVATQAVFDRVAFAPADPKAPVSSLSGGNQQKVVLSKWLLVDAQVLILAEPTRGVDVGAKAAIYGLLRKLADEGRAILVLSSELPEVLGISDRVLVMRDGTLIAEFPPDTAESEILLKAGGKPYA